ncbi:O-antigen ligase family protein [Emticicia sp. SJ17W-69]|uniref:O-antigen ligase family protein n=1 Tax=Emticicia sp. SJ17W-69 TaxID=3421657 RepID=UPI003EBAAFB9
MHTLTRYTTAVFLFLILLIPLIFDRAGFYGYVVPKALLFQVSVLLCAITYLLSDKKSWTFSYNNLSLSIAIFGTITLIINLLSYDSLFSIGATFERMEGAINTILLCLFFFLLAAILRNETNQKYVFMMMLIVAFAVAIFGILSGEKFAGRLISTIGNPAFLCFYLANHLFLIAIFYLKYKPQHKWILLIGIIVLIWAIFQTLTRTFYMAILLSAIAMLILYIYNLIKKEKRVKTLIISTLTLFFCTIIFYFISQNTWVQKNLPIGRLTNISTLDSRFLVWKIAFEGFADRWFLGWGQENFTYVYAKFFNAKLAEDGVWYDRSHNVFLDWFVAGGLLGGLCYIAIWISAILSIWRSNFHQLLKILLTGWLFFYCCFICFNPDSLVNTIFSMIILAFIYLNSPKKDINILSINKYDSIINLLFIGVLGTIFYQFTYQNIRSYWVFSKAITEPTIENLIELSNKTYTIRSAVNLNMIEQLTFMHQTVLGSQLLPEQKQLYTLSVQKLIEKEIKRHPPSVKMLELKSMIELNINDLSTGKQTLDKMIVLSPNYVLAYMQKGRAAISQSRFDEGIANFDKIIKIAPQYVPAKLYRLYAKALKDSNYDIDRELKQIPPTEIANNIKLLREIFDSLGKPEGFVNWIWNGNLMTVFMPKQVYFEWITTAFQIGDLEKLSKMLIIYRDNYECDSPLLEQIPLDAQKGIAPNQALEQLFLACPSAR